MILLVLFFLGLVLGSFLAALSYRLPRGIKISQGRSFCPNCKHQIAWFDNIPLLSYLLLRGNCRNCHQKISWRYPVIELLTGVFFVLVGPNLLFLVLSCFLITILVIDLEHMLIPDELVFWGLTVLIAISLITGSQALFSNLLAGLVWANLLLLIHFLTLGRGMGLGDVKLAILLGAALGLPLVAVGILASFLTGGIVAAILLISGRANLKQHIAFGPFMIAGFYIAWLGSQIFSFRLF